ncbi:MAG: AGE family epimerase/isomerase [Ferruginibacter sp.]|nr:AGE family epimerase/isomerase [Ferruginibacter sp.]
MIDLKQPAIPGNTALLTVYYNEVKSELNAILNYWMLNTHDAVNGGFIGRIDENNIPHPDAPKGAVLNSRILWAFSSAFKITGNPKHLHLARIAFNYLNTSFIDKAYGGVYWTLSADGRPLDTKKQIYALAFALYGCSAYFEISNNEAAKNTAIELYRQIEAHSFDSAHTGYLEAFTRDWKPLEDLRLSAKDANEKKTMNTHLHILEAYTTLYRIWPDEQLKQQIKNLIQNFIDHIVDADTGHLVLFFDEAWNRRSATVSYGHDIEAAWLLLEAAEATKETPLIEVIKKLSVQISLAATEGVDTDGGLWYEYEPNTKHIIKEKHSWVQAEAMVGFFNLWQLTNHEVYLQKSLQSWQYVKTCIKDEIYGEWLWGRNGDGTIMKSQDKVGIWKCPYHNSRACIEIIKRLQQVLDL